MARYKEAKCKLCRRENTKLFLKGERCFTDKCAIERRPYPPGQHGQMRSKLSEYGHQLREKQKIRRIYGVLESQFSRYYELSSRKKGITGENLIAYLERRLDNVVCRLGLASSRDEARQFIRHGHFLLNGHKVNIPSLFVNKGDEITLVGEFDKNAHVAAAILANEKKEMPAWLEYDVQARKGMVKGLPSRDDVTMPIQEQLVVELYSK